MKQIVLRFWYRFFKTPPLELFGNIIYPVLPGFIKKKCIAAYFNRVGFIGLLTNAISKKLEENYFSGSDQEIRKTNRELFWGALYGRSWHNVERNKYKSIEDYAATDSFQRFRKPLVDQVKELSVDCVCEIGTGNGFFIKFFADIFPSAKLIGLDINKEIIDDNIEFYKDQRLTFLADSNNDFLYKQLPDNVLLISVGTFECFTQAELEELLKSLKNSGRKVTIALSEPFDIDLTITDKSHPRGATLFSHAYEKILTNLQFRIISKLYLKRKTEDTKDNYIILTATNY
jgi:ubiquinone/menaquinone biosynthesis C-methylase UbiE